MILGINILKKKWKMKILFLMLGCDDYIFGIRCVSKCKCNVMNFVLFCNKENGICNCKLGYDLY